MNTKKCLICDNTFKPMGNMKTCSTECSTTLSTNYKLLHKKVTIKECVVCNNEFKAIGKTKTCSNVCSKESINIRVNNRYNNDINFKLNTLP